MKECCRFKTDNCAAETNPQPKENFAKDLKRKDGLTPHCKSCLKMYREKNKEQRNETIKQWRKRHPEKLKEYAKKKCALEKTKVRMKKYRLKSRYGMNQEEWQAMFEKQNGKCPICLKHSTELEEVLHIDHCHKTGKVRGLLCSRCNKAIGLLNDDFPTLKRAITYLKVGITNGL